MPMARTRNLVITLNMSKVIRTIKFKKIALHLICIFTIIYYCINKKPLKTLIKKEFERFMPDMKYVLIWTEIQGLKEEGQRYFLRRRCKYMNCYVTSNRSLFGNVLYFESILFNVRDVSREINLPEVRTPMQKYIFVANDSAAEYPVCDPHYDNLFNWTWTYRIDSTIPFSYITIYNLQDEELGINFKWKRTMASIDQKLNNQMLSKTKAVATFLDSCMSSSKKEVFLKELQNELAKFNMTVDVYGQCGTLQCSRRTIKSCHYRLKRLYHFYLVMEDFLAVDYVTRRVLDGYDNGAVPIVYGGADYDKFLPPNSYLNARSLGAKAVAAKINDAVRNTTVYFDYFRWKNYYTIKESETLNACALCEAMNNPTWLLYRSSYTTFRKWWNPSYRNACKQDKDI